MHPVHVPSSSRPKQPRAPSLEPELWLHIFRLATASPILAELSDHTYRPFDAVLWEERNWFEHGFSFTTKRSLSLVCRLWHHLVTEYLYEDLHIRRGTSALERALSCPSDGYRGHWVKRIELSSSLGDYDPFRPGVLVEILRRCPKMQTLVRKYSPGGGDPLSRCRFFDDYTFPVLSSLRRIDWWFPSGRSPGESLGFLADLLHNSPRLRYLSIGNYRTTGCRGSVPQTEQILLPQLSTLRLEAVSPELLSLIRNWRLPQLMNLVLDPSALSRRHSILHVLGSRVVSLELMRHSSFMEADYYLSHVLAECPNLSELSFHIETTLPLEDLCFSSKAPIPCHSSLQCIRVHLSSPESWSLSSERQRLRRQLVGHALWNHVLRHFLMIAVADCPRLDQVALHGDWSRWCDDVVRRLDEALLRQGYGRRRWVFTPAS